VEGIDLERDKSQEKYLDSGDTRWALLATILASGMAFLIGAAISIALPTIQSDLDTNIAGLQWIINSYALSLAVFILIGGSLGDIFGRKRIFNYGIIIFVVGSVLSGLSDSIGRLVAFQAVQGVGAALMVPGSLAIINSCVPEFRRGKAIGQWAGYSGGIGTLGPFLGGWLVQTFNWQAIFFINLPLGVLALWTSIKFIPETMNPDAQGIDWRGTFLIALGLFGLSFGLIRGPLTGWEAPSVLISLTIGVFGLILFIFNELRTINPMVPLKIFRNPLVAGANVMTLFLYFALNGVIFFLVIDFQQFQGYSPIKTGFGLLPPFILITFLSGPAGSLADRIGPRLQMIVGPLIVALGMVLFIFPGVGSNYLFDFLPGLVLFGLGMALVIAPLTKSALAVKRKYSGIASGVNNSVARVAALLAVAVMGAAVVSLFTSQLGAGVRASDLSLSEQQSILVQSDKLGGIKIPDSFGVDSHLKARRAINDSFIFGFRVAMGIGAVLAFFSSITAIISVPSSFRVQ
jgi:EmrB/QacA subfamily drug resistance transporter